MSVGKFSASDSRSGSNLAFRAFFFFDCLILILSAYPHCKNETRIRGARLASGDDDDDDKNEKALVGGESERRGASSVLERSSIEAGAVGGDALSNRPLRKLPLPPLWGMGAFSVSR